MDEHHRALVLLALVLGARAAAGLRSAPAAPLRAAPPLPPPQPQALPVDCLLPAAGAEAPDELEGLVRHLGQQLRGSNWVSEELARKRAAGEPEVRLFGAAAAPAAAAAAAAAAEVVAPKAAVAQPAEPASSPAAPPPSGGCCCSVA